MAFGGDGISRHNGKVIFVQDALPGEEVLAQLDQEKERFARAHVLERLSPAPYAQPSPCPYASRCGGCQWLTAPYAQQVDWKKSFISSALQRIGKAPLGDAALPLTLSPEVQAFRNRIKLKFAFHGSGRLELAYVARGSHELVPISACWVAEPAINRALELLRKLDGHEALRPFKAALYELELQSLPEGVTASFITRDAPHPPRALWEQLRQATRHAPELIWVAPEDQPRIFDEQDGLRYLTYGGQFQQVNLAANRLLRTRIKSMAQAVGARHILDLYCGSGNFSLQLAALGARVWGLELAPLAIDCAAENVALNGITGATYRTAAAADLLQVFPELKETQLDLVIADPPRAGMPEAIELLEELVPQHIFYISCDPNTLARDVKRLLAASYRIAHVEGFDFFPHSYHVESLVHLQR